MVDPLEYESATERFSLYSLETELVDFFNNAYMPGHDVNARPYLNAISLFSESIGCTATLADFYDENIWRFILDRIQSRTPRTILKYVSSINAIWKFAYVSGLIAKRPPKASKVEKFISGIDSIRDGEL